MVHLFSGEDAGYTLGRSFHEVGGDRRLMVELDVLHQKKSADLSPDGEAYPLLLRAALNGWVRAWIGGPPCRTRSVLRHLEVPGETMPRPLRSWNGGEWGVDGLSNYEASQLFTDDLLMMRFLLLYIVSETVRRAEGQEDPTTLVLEQPAAPEDKPEVVSWWRTPQWKRLAKLYHLHEQRVPRPKGKLLEEVEGKKKPCRFFLSDSGCKRGRNCQYGHVPDDQKRCWSCGSKDHMAPSCPRGESNGPKAAKVQPKINDKESTSTAMTSTSEKADALPDSTDQNAGSGDDMMKSLIEEANRMVSVTLAGDQQVTMALSPTGVIIGDEAAEPIVPMGILTASLGCSIVWNGPDLVIIGDEAAEPIVPMGILTASLGCSIVWNGPDLCVKHPNLGFLDIKLKDGCPVMSYDLALQLIEEIEKKASVGGDRRLMVELDVLHQKKSADLSPDGEAYPLLLRAALNGWVRAWIGGPPCRTRSVLRHLEVPGETMPRPLRSWNGGEWGVDGLSNYEASQLFTDDLLMMRFLLLYIVSETVRRAEGQEDPTTLVLEQPVQHLKTNLKWYLGGGPHNGKGLPSCIIFMNNEWINLNLVQSQQSPPSLEETFVFVFHFLAEKESPGISLV
eukprot:s237_g20.t1